MTVYPEGDAVRRHYAEEWERQIINAGGDENVAKQAVTLAALNGLFDPIGVAQAAWQPIETVPENHFTVLVYGKYGRLTAFRDVAWQWWPFPAGEPLDYIPTHWMPMPEAPVVSSTHHSAPAMEGELDTVVQLIHKHVDVCDLFDGAQELIGVEDAAKAILSALSSTDPQCTCAAIVNPNIPHARFCPLSSPNQSAPPATSSLPSGGSDPSVTLDYGGAGTALSRPHRGGEA